MEMLFGRWPLRRAMAWDCFVCASDCVEAQSGRMLWGDWCGIVEKEWGFMGICNPFLSLPEKMEFRRTMMLKR
ncbi:hypothetical protein L6452_26484 [Arctium lappa]|uniref:Uncharacterized protein n=1 Tax=Arctium lappa TaxID=4217 RepID=A0ACB8ZV90_ARCLA|nr:hypothetical protein L6452_26484 [Arctium lappa]